jgi:concentrative nucleoside transporter, CNT family
MNITIYNFVSLVGIFILLGCAWLISKHRRDLSRRVIVAGLILQCIFAFFIFIVPVGTQIFLVVNQVVVAILDSATAGIVFVFGPLGLSRAPWAKAVKLPSDLFWQPRRFRQ